MKNLKYLMLLFPLALTACGDGGPSKSEMSDLFNGLDGGVDVTVVQRACTEHENKVYVCSVSFYFRDGKDYTITEDDEFRKVDGQWETTWRPFSERTSHLRFD